MQSSFRIRLEKLRFYSRIGVFEQERRVGNEFEVSTSMLADASGFVPEQLDTTISYADVYEVVESEMKKESLLLETVAKRIADAVMQRWPQISEAEVKITKLAPPIRGIDGSCSVEYKASK